MATLDLTSKVTTGVNSDSIAALPSKFTAQNLYKIEARLDIAKLVEAGYSFASGDVFQLLEIPAKSFVLASGAEVETAFDGTSPVVDIDFAAGDDIVDGASVAATGVLAAGTNGQGFSTSGAITFTQYQAATDTIDVTLSAGANDVTSGVLRLFALVINSEVNGGFVATEVVRDQI